MSARQLALPCLAASRRWPRLAPLPSLRGSGPVPTGAVFRASARQLALPCRAAPRRWPRLAPRPQLARVWACVDRWGLLCVGSSTGVALPFGPAPLAEACASPPACAGLGLCRPVRSSGHRLVNWRCLAERPRDAGCGLLDYQETLPTSSTSHSGGLTHINVDKSRPPAWWEFGGIPTRRLRGLWICGQRGQKMAAVSHKLNPPTLAKLPTLRWIT